jgi:hypothetical protein
MRSGFIEKMLKDLGKELTGALEQFFGDKLLCEISELKKEMNEYILKIQYFRADTEIKDDYIKSYETFISSFKEDFGWCGNCMSSCFHGKSNISMGSNLDLSSKKSTSLNDKRNEFDS